MPFNWNIPPLPEHIEAQPFPVIHIEKILRGMDPPEPWDIAECSAIIARYSTLEISEQMAWFTNLYLAMTTEIERCKILVIETLDKEIPVISRGDAARIARKWNYPVPPNFEQPVAAEMNLISLATAKEITIKACGYNGDKAEKQAQNFIDHHKNTILDNGKKGKARKIDEISLRVTLHRFMSKKGDTTNRPTPTNTPDGEPKNASLKQLEAINRSKF